MKRNHLLLAGIVAGVAAVVAGSASCVTTKTVDEQRSPDPREDLPAISSDEQKQLEVKKQAKLAQDHPLDSVIDLSPQDPIVNVRVVFKAGSADDPAGKEGLATLSVMLMREATEKLSAADLADALFPWAAELDVQVDKDAVAFLGRVHKDHQDQFGDIFLDVILHPRLDTGDFARKMAEQKAFLESTLRTGNDELLQRETLEQLIYPAGHPYHHTPRGTVKGLNAITLDDVRGFIHAHLVRDRVVLGISGGASASLVAKVRAGLESLPFADAPRAEVAAPVQAARNRAILVDKPAAGSAISLGYAVPELSRTSPDYPAMKLAETWFGEHRSLIGHLFNSMRERRGLNYGDYAYVEHFVQEGWSTYERLNTPRRTQYFSMWIRPVEHKNRLFALRQAAWELDQFAKDGIPDDDSFERVRSFVQGYWRAKEQEPMRRLGYAIDRVLTEQPFDHDDLRARVAKLTRADVNAAIKRHLHGDKLAIVVITENAAALADEIKKGTPSPVSYAGKVPPAQLSEDKVIEAFDLHLGDAVHVIPAGDLFAE